MSRRADLEAIELYANAPHEHRTLVDDYLSLNERQAALIDAALEWHPGPVGPEGFASLLLVARRVGAAR